MVIETWFLVALAGALVVAALFIAAGIAVLYTDVRKDGVSSAAHDVSPVAHLPVPTSHAAPAEEQKAA